MVLDKQIYRDQFIEPYKQNPLEKFLIFTIYQNYTLANILFTFANISVYYCSKVSIIINLKWVYFEG